MAAHEYCPICKKTVRIDKGEMEKTANGWKWICSNPECRAENFTPTAEVVEMGQPPVDYNKLALLLLTRLYGFQPSFIEKVVSNLPVNEILTTMLEVEEIKKKNLDAVMIEAWFVKVAFENRLDELNVKY